MIAVHTLLLLLHHEYLVLCFSCFCCCSITLQTTLDHFLFFFFYLSYSSFFFNLSSWKACSSRWHELLLQTNNALKAAAINSNAKPTTCNTYAKCEDEEQDSSKCLSRAEVEAVMGRLGLINTCCSSSSSGAGDDQVGLARRIGSDDVAALFEEEGVSMEEAEAAFGVFDSNSDGFIDASELKKVLTDLGFAHVAEADCQAMIRGFDVNGDGRVDFAEFNSLLFETGCSLN